LLDLARFNKTTQHGFAPLDRNAEIGGEFDGPDRAR